MDREFATLLMKKLHKRASELHNDASDEINPFTASYLRGQASTLYEVCTAVVETFNELDGKK